MKTFVAFVTLLAVANARTFMLPNPADFGPNRVPESSFGSRPGYPAPIVVNKPQLTRPAVVEEPIFVAIDEEEAAELEAEEAPLPCNPNVIGVVVHPEPEPVEEEQEEVIVEGASGTFYPIVINRPSIGTRPAKVPGPQTKPGIFPPSVIGVQQRPSITPTGPVQQQRPSVVPVGPSQQRPAISPVAPSQQLPSITPVGPSVIEGPLIRPAPVQPCALPVEEEEEAPAPQGRPQTRPQILPVVLPAPGGINTRPVLPIENERQPVAVVVEQDGDLRPIYDYIR